MSVTRDDWHGGELWAFRLDDYERLSRVVLTRIRRADWFDGWSIDIKSSAEWIGEPESTYTVDREYRWYGATSTCPPGLFREVLEMALKDAKQYTTIDLHPSPWPANAGFGRRV